MLSAANNGICLAIYYDNPDQLREIDSYKASDLSTPSNSAISSTQHAIGHRRVGGLSGI